MKPRDLAFALAALLLPFDTAPAAESAEAAEYVGRTPPRVSLVEGQVSFWRAGAPEWEPAQINLPLAPGDFLHTAADSRTELQIGGRAFVRAAADTQLALDAHDGSLLRFSVSQGRIALDLRELAAGARLEVDTPEAKLYVAQAGFYDVLIDSGRATFAAYRGGRATMSAGGEVVEIDAGMQVESGTGMRFARGAAAPPDDWYFWNTERTDRILAATSRAHVSADVYGVRELDDYGEWRDTNEYGRVWVPANVGPTWAPYTTGRWLADPEYGWTWVDSAPWGWAPYHYGRWVWFGSYWGWAPGPIVTPVYSPALVGFYGGGGVSVGVSVGIGFPYVGWVALGWGEPVYPWWGPTWYRGYPCWGGWGGPTIINNVVVNKYPYPRYGDRRRHDRDGDDGDRDRGPHKFRNQGAPHAMVAARRGDLGRRSFERVRLSQEDRGRMLPLRGSPADPSEGGTKQVRTHTNPPQLDGRRVQRVRTAAETSPRRAADPARGALPSRSAEAARPAAGTSTADAAGRRLGDAPRAPRSSFGESRRPEPPRRPVQTRERLARRSDDAFGLAPSAPSGARRNFERSRASASGAEGARPRRSAERPPERGFGSGARPSSDRPPVSRPSAPRRQDAFEAGAAPAVREVPRRMPVDREGQPIVPRSTSPERVVSRPSVERPAAPQAPPVERPSTASAPRPVSRNDGGSSGWGRPSSSGGGSGSGGGGQVYQPSKPSSSFGGRPRGTFSGSSGGGRSGSGGAASGRSSASSGGDGGGRQAVGRAMR